jgi:hypothetical protein
MGIAGAAASRLPNGMVLYCNVVSDEGSITEFLQTDRKNILVKTYIQVVFVHPLFIV